FDELSEEARQLYEYDVEAAREILAAAGYADGLDLSVITPTRDYQPEYQDFVALVIDMWSDIGVNAQMVVTETAARDALRSAHEFQDLIGWRLVTTDALNGLRHGTSYLG